MSGDRKLSFGEHNGWKKKKKKKDTTKWGALLCCFFFFFWTPIVMGLLWVCTMHDSMVKIFHILFLIESKNI